MAIEDGILVTAIGSQADSEYYRVDLSASGVSRIGSITLADDLLASGGTGAASGFDLDFVKLSKTFTDSPSEVDSLVGIDVFAFDGSGTHFDDGFRQPYRAGDPASWDTEQLFGTKDDGTLDFTAANFDVPDDNGVSGWLSMGEGGVISFDLKSSLDTTGLYLYIGDVGGGNDFIKALVAAGAATPVSGLDLTGSADDDTIVLGDGLNASVGEGDDRIIGGEGNDTIGTSSGNDLLGGSPGDDVLYGGTGNDGLDGGDGSDIMIGGDGNDIMVADDGGDQLLGGAGDDRMGGGAGNDGMAGQDGNDVIDGSDYGDDAMDGGTGDDILALGKGNDSAAGGEGTDLFYLRLGGPGVDRITDFLVGTDHLRDDTALGIDTILAGAVATDEGTVLKIGEDDFVVVQGVTGISADWFA